MGSRPEAPQGKREKNPFVSRIIMGEERGSGNSGRKAGYIDNLRACSGRVSHMLLRAARRQWSGKMETDTRVFSYPEDSQLAEFPMPEAPCIRCEVAGHGKEAQHMTVKGASSLRHDPRPDSNPLKRRLAASPRPCPQLSTRRTVP